MKIYFVGAGPGDPELLTVKAQRLLRQARRCVYAGSLLSAELIDLLPPAARRWDSAGMTLEEIVEVYREAQRDGVDLVRLHAGEPSLYGAIGEQMDALDRLGIDYEVVPGISAFQAAAAALKVELTAPEVAQTVILTRTPGRTPMPASEELSHLAQSRATLCIFLSAERLAQTAATLAEHYGPDCPAAVVYHASWPDQKVVRGTLADIAQHGAADELTKTAILLVGHALARPLPHASKLYDSAFSHGHRRADRKGTVPFSPRENRDSPPGDRLVKIALISLSNAGARIVARLAAKLPLWKEQGASSTCEIFLHTDVAESPHDVSVRFERIADLTREVFSNFQGLVYIAPAGVVVRAVAPCLQHKTTDPGVVVVDVGARWAVSLVGGHEGGANALAVAVANALDAEPVVTTTAEAAKDLIVGVGCRRGTPAVDIIAAVQDALAAAHCEPARVRLLATVDLKADEVGLWEAARRLEVPLRWIAGADIRTTIRAFEHSPLVQEKVDLPAVAEPAALLAGRRTRLLLPKTVIHGVTVAIAREDFMPSA
jgi:precorrin-4/cobalt-precorrin-4 C11-methyltransferase